MSGSAIGDIPSYILEQWGAEAASGIHPRRANVGIPVTIVLGTAVLLFVGARAWVRIRIQKKLDVSDWLTFITAPMTLAYLVMVCFCVQQYYNRHLWELTDDERVKALQYFFFGYFFYFWNSALVRLSILFFYLRLTDRTIHRKFIWIVWATIAFTIAYWVVFDISLVFTCTPVSAFWLRASPIWTATHTYHCFDEGAHIMAASAVAALDLFVAVLPAMLFWNMHLPRRQKIAIWGLFGIGACTGVASLVRMYFIYLDFWKSYDFTWIGYEIWLWTSTELAVAIVCASAPALKTIFIKFFGGERGDRTSAGLSRTGGRSRLNGGTCVDEDVEQAQLDWAAGTQKSEKERSASKGGLFVKASAMLGRGRGIDATTSSSNQSKRTGSGSGTSDSDFEMQHYSANPTSHSTPFATTTTTTTAKSGTTTTLTPLTPTATSPTRNLPPQRSLPAFLRASDRTDSWTASNYGNIATGRATVTSMRRGTSSDDFASEYDYGRGRISVTPTLRRRGEVDEDELEGDGGRGRDAGRNEREREEREHVEGDDMVVHVRTLLEVSEGRSDEEGKAGGHGGTGTGRTTPDAELEPWMNAELPMDMLTLQPSRV